MVTLTVYEDKQNVQYYCPKEIYATFPQDFPGCSKSGRALIKYLIKNNKIDTSNYILCIGNKRYTLENAPSKAQALIRKDWFDNYVVENKLTQSKIKHVEIAEEIKQLAICQDELKQIILTEDEKMINNANVPFDVKCYGQREYGKCYFSYEDICVGLDVDASKNANQIMDNYKINEDYIYVSHPFKKADEDKKITKTNSTYLTCNGLWKFVFKMNSPKAYQLQKWACKILYTHALGTTEQKQDLASTLVGIDIKQFIAMIRGNDKPAGVYMICIGTLDTCDKKITCDIPNKDKYNSNDLIIKFGRSENLAERLTTHLNTYKNCPVSLFTFALLDTDSVVDAEADIKKMLIDYYLDVKKENMSELLIVPNNKIDYIRMQMNKIRSIHQIKHIELTKMIESIQQEITHQKELINQKDTIIKMKDDMIDEKNKRLAEKDKLIMEKDKNAELKDELLNLLREKLK